MNNKIKSKLLIKIRYILISKFIIKQKLIYNIHSIYFKFNCNTTINVSFLMLFDEYFTLSQRKRQKKEYNKINNLKYIIN